MIYTLRIFARISKNNLRYVILLDFVKNNNNLQAYFSTFPESSKTIKLQEFNYYYYFNIRKVFFYFLQCILYVDNKKLPLTKQMKTFRNVSAIYFYRILETDNNIHRHIQNILIIFLNSSI